MKPAAILETCLYVDDLEVAEAFYRDVIGLEFYAKVPGRHCFFRCGDGMFLLFDAEATRTPPGSDKTGHGADGSGHVAFRMTEDEVEGWRERLISANVEIGPTYEWPESLDHTKTHGDWTAELINYEYRVKRAQYAFKAGEEEEAVRLLKEAASLVHHDKRALHTIALTYARADRLDDAIGAFEAALHDDPAYTRALYNLANALLRQERYAEAKPYAVILLDQSPVSPRFKRLNEKILQGLATLQDEN